jgi:SAM-dependent methyltransferase
MSSRDPSGSIQVGPELPASTLFCVGRARRSWARRWRWLARAYWNLHSRRWDNRTADRRWHEQRVLRWMDPTEQGQGTRVLDIGCGTGNHALALAKRGLTIVGLDFAPGMLARARAKMDSSLAGSARFLQVDFNDGLPFPESSFDAALALAVLHGVDDVPHFLREVRRILRPGGLFLVGALRFRETQSARNYSRDRRTRLLWRISRACPGWRKRMRLVTLDDLRGLLADERFAIVGSETSPGMLTLLTRAEPPGSVSDGARPAYRTES